mmetsp:Transcript_32073/g.74384  ORF Transcript_32073/g.74384 Transcript_32073/m.74384 type:complete len:107 (-) Transcript_32073:56-376(-)
MSESLELRGSLAEPLQACGLPATDGLASAPDCASPIEAEDLVRQESMWPILLDCPVLWLEASLLPHRLPVPEFRDVLKLRQISDGAEVTEQSSRIEGTSLQPPRSP